jgi:preprotein translocase subunit SecY
MIIIMTAGTAVIMWLGELITDRGSATACRC